MILLPSFQICLSGSIIQNTISNSVTMHHYFPLLSKAFLSSSNFQNIVSNSARMLHFVSLLLNFSQQFLLQEHRFKQCHNALFYPLDVNFFSAVPTSNTPFQIAPECTILLCQLCFIGQCFDEHADICDHTLQFVKYLQQIILTGLPHYQTR